MLASTSSVGPTPSRLEDVISAVLEIVDTDDFAAIVTNAANDDDNNASFDSLAYVAESKRTSQEEE